MIRLLSLAFSCFLFGTVVGAGLKYRSMEAQETARKVQFVPRPAFRMERSETEKPVIWTQPVTRTIHI